MTRISVHFKVVELLIFTFFSQFCSENKAVMQVKWIDIHTHRKWNRPDLLFVRQAWSISLAKPGYFLSNGIHPWQAEKAFFDVNWDSLLQNPQVLFVGESGLDRLKPNLDAQMNAFRWMIDLATRHQKPLLIHNVRMHQEIQRELKSVDCPIILHGFSANQHQLNAWLKFPRVYFSLGKRELQRGLLPIPLNRLFFETDTARNDVQQAYHHFCHHTQIPLEELQKQVIQNFNEITANRLFISYQNH